MGGLCSIATDFKIFKCCFPFQFLKSKFAVGHFHITTQLQSVRSDDSVIYSTTSPLHHFYYIHFASDSNYDPNPAASGRFIDSTTLPLQGDPIHNVCDVPYHLHHGSLLIGESFLQSHTARLNHNTSDSADDSVILRINTLHLLCDMKMPHRNFVSF
jgi:hypothetical protein